MSYELMFQRALQLQQNGALNEAEQLYRQILETAPDNADVLNLLGLIAQTKGLHHEAVPYFYRAINSAPQHFPIYFNLAVSLSAVERPVEAIEAYQKVLSLKPDVKEAYYGMGNIYWQQDDRINAEQSFQKALEIDGNYLAAAVNLAELKADDSALKKLAENNPKFAEPQYYLGRRALENGDFAKAQTFLQKADELLVSDEIKTLLATSLLAQNQNDEALKYFYQAYNINSHNFDAALNIADLEVKNENFTEAEKFYKKAIELNGGNMQAHANYANMLCKRNRTLEALEEYRAAVRIAPEAPELSFNLSIILKMLEEYEQALSLMFNAFYLAPERADWSLNLAETLILFHRQAPEKALKITENWYNRMPDNTVVKHLWSVLNGKEPENDGDYNKLLFENFAQTYESTLERINYQVADKISELAVGIKGRILDLGCGTGLVGAKLKNENNTLVGVDLSQAMLDIAKQKNVYSELVCTDALEYLQSHAGEFTAIVAGDVLCYFGDLSALLSAGAPTKLIFSVETGEDVENYAVEPSGRYRHNPQYVRQTLVKAGYNDIEEHPLILRQENAQNVNGMIFVAKVNPM